MTCPTSFRCPEIPVLADLRARNPRLVDAGVMGAVTLAWYAMPDLVRSRPLRTVLKTGLFAVGAHQFALSVHEDALGGWVRDEAPVECDCSDECACGTPCTDDEHCECCEVAAADRADDACDCGEDCECGTPCEKDSHCTCCFLGEDSPFADVDRRVLIGAGAGLALAGAALTVAVEKAIFRRGERRRAAGHRLAHLRQALPLAALAAAPVLVPQDLDEESTWESCEVHSVGDFTTSESTTPSGAASAEE